MLALTHCKAGKIVQAYGAKADYALCAAQWDSSLSYTGRWFKTAKALDQVAQKKYGYKSTTYQVAESAASVVVFADAFVHAGSIDPKAVPNEIHAVDTMPFYT